MIRVNDVIEIESIQYRVVQLFGCLALLIPMNGQSVYLISMDADELNESLSKGKVLLKEDKWIALQYKSLSDNMLKAAEASYQAILPIVSNPMLYTSDGRRKLVQAYAKGDRLEERRLNQLIGIYWRRGQSKYALVPDYGKNTGHTSSGAKRGRKGRENANGTAL